MDKNSIIGIIVIIGILVGFSILNKPSAEEVAELQRKKDSIAQVEAIKKELAAEASQTETVNNTTNTIVENAVDTLESDTAKLSYYKDVYGDFGVAAIGEKNYVVLENEVMRLKVSTLGGRPYSVELKDYKTFDGKPLVLFDGDSTVFNLGLVAKNRDIATNDLFFEADFEGDTLKVTDAAKSLSMKLKVSDEHYIEYLYTMEPGSYMVNFDVNFVGMNTVLPRSINNIPLTWESYIPSMEKGRDNESNYTSLYYKQKGEKVDNFNARGKKTDEVETLSGRVKWVAFKNQFFSSVLIADNQFERGEVSYERYAEGPYLRKMNTRLDISYNGMAETSMPMSFYFGPNHFQTLSKFEIDLEDLVNLGGAIIRPVSKWLIIPVFNFLNRFISNYGIIILLLTIFIKLILIPFTFKAYMSQARMRVLKPEIDQINKKIPKEKAMERQKETMALYKKVGVNPMGGCLITFLQFPILFAMFRFFPASIELRQESFLWATDLSTYDSIFEWTQQIPLISKYYGNHISLFTLLMTVTTILSMKMNNTSTAQTEGMPGMKTMMYIMPVMFMFVLNNFSAGLTYYYFLANVITLGQNYLFRIFVDEEEVLRKLHSKKAKNSKKKKKGFQARLEEMARQRGVQMPKK